jgi:hypothetical protein
VKDQPGEIRANPNRRLEQQREHATPRLHGLCRGILTLRWSLAAKAENRYRLGLTPEAPDVHHHFIFVNNSSAAIAVCVGDHGLIRYACSPV